MSIALYWPIALVVISNTVYHICAKSMPEDIHPFASLTVTYLVSAVLSGLLYFALEKSPNLAREYSHLNWVPIVLGFALIGLEAGSIYMYKLGWNVNTGYIVQSVFIAVALMIVGFLLFKEQITWTKALGLAICMVGLYFLNK